VSPYAYVGNMPTIAADPTGRACVSRGGLTTCQAPFEGAPRVSFPTPVGFPANLNSQVGNYHSYNVSVNAGTIDVGSMRREIQINPTPGSALPATITGTLNNATPTIIQRAANLVDTISSFGTDSGGYNNSPVISYIRADEITGRPITVNVTQPGHPLHPGYVARDVVQNSGNTIVNNYGEGSSVLQSPLSPAAPFINGVWTGQTNEIVQRMTSTPTAASIRGGK
jgi:hypothetical protein